MILAAVLLAVFAMVAGSVAGNALARRIERGSRPEPPCVGCDVLRRALIEATPVASEPEPHANVYVPRCGLVPLPARHAVRWVAGGDA